MLKRLAFLLVWLFVVAQIYGVGLYYQLILQSIGAVLATLVAFVAIAVPFVVMLWLKAHANPWLRGLADALEVVASHSALLYGTVLTVLVFLAVGLINGGAVPDEVGKFLIEFVTVCAVTSALIYGSMMLLVVAFGESGVARGVGLVIGLVVIGVPVGWFTVHDFQAVAERAPSQFLLAWTAYLAVGSVVCWRVFLLDVAARRRESPKGRRAKGRG